MKIKGYILIYKVDNKPYTGLRMDLKTVLYKTKQNAENQRNSMPDPSMWKIYPAVFNIV